MGVGCGWHVAGTTRAHSSYRECLVKERSVRFLATRRPAVRWADCAMLTLSVQLLPVGTLSLRRVRKEFKCKLQKKYG